MAGRHVAGSRRRTPGRRGPHACSSSWRRSSRSVRVLVASGTWSPERNGVARVAVETARELARRGHDLTVLAPRADDAATEADEEGLRVLRGLVRGRLPLLVTDVSQSRRVARGLREPFDVVLAHGAMLATGIGGSKSAAPLAYVHHAS